MWTYIQISGRLYHEEELIGVGYSGGGEGKNNPDLQDVKDVGPIPRGKYSIGTPVDTVMHGPYAMALTPDPANDMAGREGFLIHGDSVSAPGTASEGCVIMSRDVREEVWTSMDHDLEVLSGTPVDLDV